MDSDKTTYWKKRISDRLGTMNDSLKVDFNAIAEMVDHIHLKNVKEITVKMNVLLLAINKLEQEILKGKVKEVIN